MSNTTKMKIENSRARIPNSGSSPAIAAGSPGINRRASD
jgi:hypothetical protein